MKITLEFKDKKIETELKAIAEISVGRSRKVTFWKGTANETTIELKLLKGKI